VAAAAIVLLMLLLIVLARRRRREAAADVEPRYRPHRQRGLDGEMHALAQELSAMIESAGAQLDARAERLRSLIRAADERIAQLQQETRAEADDGASADEPPPPAPARMPAPLITAASSQSDVDPRHAQIYALSAEGMSIQQIADRTGRPEGEVELILALRPRGRAAG
jgi:DNA-binding NarL/FixJ family response regulator